MTKIASKDEVIIRQAEGEYEFPGKLVLSNRDREILLSDGLLKYTLKKANE
jgi:hypothetical protein